MTWFFLDHLFLLFKIQWAFNILFMIEKKQCSICGDYFFCGDHFICGDYLICWWHNFWVQLIHFCGKRRNLLTTFYLRINNPYLSTSLIICFCRLQLTDYTLPITFCKFHICNMQKTIASCAINVLHVSPHVAFYLFAVFFYPVIRVERTLCK